MWPSWICERAMYDCAPRKTWVWRMLLFNLFIAFLGFPLLSRFFEYPCELSSHVTYSSEPWYSCLNVIAVVGLDNSTWAKNGVHIRGLLLYVGASADGGAHFLRYLACKCFEWNSNTFAKVFNTDTQWIVALVQHRAERETNANEWHERNLVTPIIIITANLPLNK